jgi:hypothetical protein
VSTDGETITVHIPMTFTKRGGRKLVVTPDGAAWAPRPRVDNAMVKALARAFRWRKMLDEGAFGTLEDLAKSKGIAKTYVSQVLRLTSWRRRSWRRSSMGGSRRSCSWMIRWRDSAGVGGAEGCVRAIRSADFPLAFSWGVQLAGAGERRVPHSLDVGFGQP